VEDAHSPFFSEIRLMRPCVQNAVGSGGVRCRWVVLVLLAGAATLATATDTVVLFNELMYHPAADESRMEWLELHNRLIVDVDLSGWSITGGIDYTFPDGAVIPAEGTIVVAISPQDLAAAAGLTDVPYGPFEGRLSNSGERLELRNNSGRIMDEMDYRDGGDWPVAPDGSGVSLAKINPDVGGPSPTNWTWSRQVGGTPGRVNFPRADTGPIRTPLIGTWEAWDYNDAGQPLGETWKDPGQPAGDWAVGPAGFYAGPAPGGGQRAAIPTVFSTGLDEQGQPLAYGQPDPHYTDTATGEAVYAMQNHSAWLANTGESQWIGLSGQGTDNFPAGSYTFATQFDLSGFDAATAELTVTIAVDDVLSGVRLNGVNVGIECSGFSSWSGPFTIDSGFIEGLNTLEFAFVNGGSSPNPSGLRVALDGSAVLFPGRTALSASASTYYFRKPFVYEPTPDTQASLDLDGMVDDGAVFYLNGQQVGALNMPDGPIAYDTPALEEVADPLSPIRITLDGGLLAAGENLLAVEVHHAPASTDAFFAASLTVIETPISEAPLPGLIINEITSAKEWPFRVELLNDGDRALNVGGLVLICKGTTGGRYVLPASTPAPGEYLVLDEFTLGFHPSDEDKLFLYTADGDAVIDAAVVKNSHRARYPDGHGDWAYPSQATFGSANLFDFQDAIVINEILYHPSSVPESEAEYEDTVLLGSFVPVKALVPTEAEADLDWQGGAEPFDDSAWTHGQGDTTGVGFELSQGYETLIGTDVREEMYGKNASVYMRIPFNVDAPDAVETLRLLMKYDDGFVAYLNGVEVAHGNAPGRDGNTQTLRWDSRSTASRPDDQAVVFAVFDITAYKQHLRAGPNTLAIHGLNWSTGSTDMLILPELHARREVRPYIPFHEPTQEWVELFNRGEHTVSLAGWKLTGGISYDFEPDVVLGPGEYLVVARDSAALRAELPGVAVVGDFEGRLSNRADELILEDGNKNVADRVRYSDRGYWPAWADGGGSSLELRDPFADNACPLAWAASDERPRAAWKTYTYRAVAAPTPNGNEPTLWNEFIFGLLDAGEFLIDDIRVVEDPDGAAVQLIQNGSFQSGAGAWRFLGNHAFATVVPDPDKPDNFVLHVHATGPTEHMHNHIETTLAGNRAIVNGRVYEISFRAKWLGGGHLLNTRLYFNRAPRTTALLMPSAAGTPGRRNSRYEPNIGPTLGDLRHSPAVPNPGAAVAISVRAEDPDGVDAVNLLWCRDGEPFETLAMDPAADGTWGCTLPGLDAGTLVRFYVQAEDSLGAVGVWPPTGPDSRALFKVNDGQAHPGRHNVRVLMTAADTALLHASTNVMSNHRMPATVIWNERDIYYDVGLHLKGSGYGRNNNRVGYNIRFRPEALFCGVHDTVAIDRNGGPGGIGASHRELVLKHIGNRAAGIPGMYDDVIYLISPAGNLNGPAQLMMARYDDAFLGAQFVDGQDGTLYEFELIYYSQSTDDGSAEGLKQPPSAVLAVDLRDMGDDKEGYRWNYLIKNNRATDEFDAVMTMAKTFGLSGAALDERIEQVIDVDEWMRVFAFESLGGVGDTYNQGLAHNIMFYTRPEDGRVLALPWDMDFAFYQSTGASIFGGGSNLQKVIALDRFKRLFYTHLYDIMQTAFNTEYLEPWVQHYAGPAGQNVSSEILSRVEQRRNYVLGQLPAQVPFVITTNAGVPLAVDTDHVTIQGRAWIDVYRIRLAGQTEPLDVTWTGITTWKVTVPLAFGPNVLTFEACDYQGRPIASANITVTSSVSTHPLRQYLRVTEVMYDPPGGKDYEFIEFQNTGPVTLDLTPVRITDGIEYAFAEGDITALAPGAFVVVAENVDAFRQRYGPAIPVAGQYGGALANDGETVRIEGRFGAPILSFTYDDGRGWPAAADGGGHALVPLERVMADQPDGSLDYGGNWRAGTYILGSPGTAEPLVPVRLVLNEVMAHTDYDVPPHDSNDWIELYNTGDGPVHVDGTWYLSDDVAELRKWALPSRVIGRGEYVSFDEVSDFHNPITEGFGLDKAGEAVYLSHLPGGGTDRIVDAIVFKGQPNAVSLGRFPDGVGFWQALAPSRDAPNTEPVRDAIISEVMSVSAAAAPGLEYVELFNLTNSPILLEEAAGRWRLEGSVWLTFPAGTFLRPSGRLLVVGFDPVVDSAALTAFQDVYDLAGLVPGADIVGPWRGALTAPAGRVALEKPQAPDVLGQDVSWIINDEVYYFDRMPWPQVYEPAKPVLQRQVGRSPGNDPASWRRAEPTPGRRAYACGDVNRDGLVDLFDWELLGRAWLSEMADPAYDDQADVAPPPNGLVDLDDLLQFTQDWLGHTRPMP